MGLGKLYPWTPRTLGARPARWAGRTDEMPAFLCAPPGLRPGTKGWIHDRTETMSIDEVVAMWEPEDGPAKDEDPRSEAVRATEIADALAKVQDYLDLVLRTLLLEPKMAAALIPKAHRKALDYAKLVGDE